MRTYNYTITKSDSGKKILEFLRGNQGFSHGLVTKLKQKPDGIMKNGVHARTVDRLVEGDVLTICVYDENPKEIIVSDIQATVVFEDEDVIVFDKPPFMPVHQSRWHQADTLANSYASYCVKNNLSPASFRSINRLDKDTSGLVAVAKNRHAAGYLAGNIQKEYLAVIEGKLENKQGIIDAPIDRAYPDGLNRCVKDNGQQAITHYEVLGECKSHSLVACKLETGRTHQIRVHFSHIGHPLVGDEPYGGKTDLINRQALHCHKLIFTCPQKTAPVMVIAEIPQDMQRVCEKIGLKLK